MKMTKRQTRAFTQEPDEDPYAWVVRTMRTLRYRDLPHLMLVRSNDRKQMEAIQLYANLKMVQWTRGLTLGTVALGACTIVAALIARS